jgi:hypothetical protein
MIRTFLFIVYDIVSHIERKIIFFIFFYFFFYRINKTSIEMSSLYVKYMVADLVHTGQVARYRTDGTEHPSLLHPAGVLPMGQL